VLLQTPESAENLDPHMDGRAGTGGIKLACDNTRTELRFVHCPVQAMQTALDC
jgi:hypothetical protein